MSTVMKAEPDLDSNDNNSQYHVDLGCRTSFLDKTSIPNCQKKIDDFSSDDDDSFSSATSHPSDRLSISDYIFRHPDDLPLAGYRYASHKSQKRKERQRQQELQNPHQLYQPPSLFNYPPTFPFRRNSSTGSHKGSYTNIYRNCPSDSVNDGYHDLEMTPALQLSTKFTPKTSSPYAPDDNENDIYMARQQHTSVSSATPSRSLYGPHSHAQSKKGKTIGLGIHHQQHKRSHPSTSLPSAPSALSTLLPQHTWKEEYDDDGFDDVDIPIGFETSLPKNQQRPQTISRSSNNNNPSNLVPSPVSASRPSIQNHLLMHKEDKDHGLSNVTYPKDCGNAFVATSRSKRQQKRRQHQRHQQHQQNQQHQRHQQHQQYQQHQRQSPHSQYSRLSEATLSTAPKIGGREFEQTHFIDPVFGKWSDSENQVNLSKSPISQESVGRPTPRRRKERPIAKDFFGMTYENMNRQSRDNEQTVRPFDNTLQREIETSQTRKSTFTTAARNTTFDPTRITSNSSDKTQLLDKEDDVDTMGGGSIGNDCGLTDKGGTSRNLYQHNCGNRNNKYWDMNNMLNKSSRIPTTTSTCRANDMRHYGSKYHTFGDNKTASNYPELSSSQFVEAAWAASTLVPPNQHRRHQQAQQQSRSSPRYEFVIPIDMQRQMLDDERRHRNLMDAWPLVEHCKMALSPFGHYVPQHTYILC